MVGYVHTESLSAEATADAEQGQYGGPLHNGASPGLIRRLHAGWATALIRRVLVHWLSRCRFPSSCASSKFKRDCEQLIMNVLPRTHQINGAHNDLMLAYPVSRPLSDPKRRENNRCPQA